MEAWPKYSKSPLYFRSISILTNLTSLPHSLLHHVTQIYPGALSSLRCKKLHEAEIDKIANIKITLETQLVKITAAAGDATTVKTMEEARNAMKAIREDTDIDKVDDLMDAIKEEMEIADEISNSLAQPIDPLLADDDVLLAELLEMEEDNVEDPGCSLPDVPRNELPAIPNVTKEEEEELKQLEAESAG
mmetsp:Transcript_1121/g.1874  ORF Transcript_1121/g.1874 Transcript_1121/m.1874 type:complete len:190 (+) Transcript_1121:68-637(+)